MEKVKQFLKDHRDELIIYGAGMVAGIIITRTIYERNLSHTTNLINNDLMQTFSDNQGNFQRPDGSFPVPKIVRL